LIDLDFQRKKLSLGVPPAPFFTRLQTPADIKGKAALHRSEVVSSG